MAHIICALAVLLILAQGCAAGITIDTRFWGEPIERIEIDGYPVDVQVLQISDTVYDVAASEGRIIGFSGTMEPLAYNDRFRRAALAVMKNRFAGASIKTQGETTAVGYMALYIRYEITP